MFVRLRKRPHPSSRPLSEAEGVRLSPLSQWERGETASAASQSGVRAKQRFYNICVHSVVMSSGGKDGFARVGGFVAVQFGEQAAEGGSLQGFQQGQ